jgi:hypothetical protein
MRVADAALLAACCLLLAAACCCLLLLQVRDGRTDTGPGGARGCAMLGGSDGSQRAEAARERLLALA